MLVRSSYFHHGVSSESATTSINNKSYSGTIQRSDDVTVDSMVSGRRVLRLPLRRDVEGKNDDSSTSPLAVKRKLSDRTAFSSKQLPHRPTSVALRNSKEDEQKPKARKVPGPFSRFLLNFHWNHALTCKYSHCCSMQKFFKKNWWWLQMKRQCRINGFQKDLLTSLSAPLQITHHPLVIQSLMNHKSLVGRMKKGKAVGLFSFTLPGYNDNPWNTNSVKMLNLDQNYSDRRSKSYGDEGMHLAKVHQIRSFDVWFVQLTERNCTKGESSIKCMMQDFGSRCLPALPAGPWSAQFEGP